MLEFDLNVEQLQEVLDTLDMVDIDAKSTDSHVLKVIRIKLQTAKKQIGKLMSDTTTKDYSEILSTYEDGEIEEYISCIIEGAWTADSAKAAYIAEHEDIQKLRCFDEQIKKAVEASPFSIKNFKIKHLQTIRTKLAASKTIHELRQWCKMMAAQLEYYRGIEEELKESKQTVEWLSAETNRMYKITEEAYRVVSCVVPYYDAGMNDIALLKNIENAKKVNNLSDAEAAKLFGVSRTKLLSLRADIKLDALTPAQIATLRNQRSCEITDMLLEDVSTKVQELKTEEDLEYEEFLGIYTTLDDVLPMDAEELEMKTKEVRAILEKNKQYRQHINA